MSVVPTQVSRYHRRPRILQSDLMLQSDSNITSRPEQRTVRPVCPLSSLPVLIPPLGRASPIRFSEDRNHAFRRHQDPREPSTALLRPINVQEWRIHLCHHIAVVSRVRRRNESDGDRKVRSSGGVIQLREFSFITR